MQFDEKVKKLYYHMQVAQKQLKSLQEQHEGLQNKEMEIYYIKQSLGELSSTDDGKDILVPINNGIFVRAKIEKSDQVLVNVGSDVVVGKSIEGTQDMMDRQLAEIKKYKADLEKDIETVATRLQKMEDEFYSIQKEMENV